MIRVKRLSQIFVPAIGGAFLSLMVYGEASPFNFDPYLFQPKENPDKTFFFLAQLELDPSNQAFSTDLPNADQPQLLNPGQYRVVEGDTLWSIARRLRFNGISVVQTMEAIFRYNSSAFDGDDVSSLEIGAMIWLPTSDEVRLEFGTFVSPGIERIDPDRLQTQALLSSIDRSAKEEQRLIPKSSSFIAPSGTRSKGAFMNDSEDQKEEIESAKAKDTDAIFSKDTFDADNKNEGSSLATEFTDDFELISASSSDIEKNPDDLLQDSTVIAEADSEIGKGAVASFLVLITVLATIFAFSRRRISQTSVYSASHTYALPHDQDTARYDEFDGEEIKLFDETDEEIFPDQNQEVSSRFFDSMVDPMVDAEMYLSVGKIAQAIDVLQEERFAKPTDTACRVRLMQVLFEEKQTKDLEVIFREIEAIGDQDSVNVAEGILSASKQYFQNSPHAESNGVDLDLPREFILVHDDNEYSDNSDHRGRAKKSPEILV